MGSENASAALVRVAHRESDVSVLGPGNRMVIWFQGCSFACPGCVSPEFQLTGAGEPMRVDLLIDGFCQAPQLDGVTISGGEPFQQASGLAFLVQGIRLKRPDTSIIVYSGYTLDQLRKRAIYENHIFSILSVIDVLIDGLYEHSLNDSRGLRGSCNQTVHFLSERHASDRRLFEEAERKIEVRGVVDERMMAGIPDLEEWRRVSFSSDNDFYRASPSHNSESRPRK